MTAHEFAKKLLEGPDLPIFGTCPEPGEVCSVYYMEPIVTELIRTNHWMFTSDPALSGLAEGTHFYRV